jgi:hypothetical protein
MNALVLGVVLPVPGRKCTFGVLKAAQARGDFDVLVERDRRALRAHLGTDVAAGLSTLRGAFLAALGPARNRSQYLRSCAYRCCALSHPIRFAWTHSEHDVQMAVRLLEVYI